MGILITEIINQLAGDPDDLNLTEELKTQAALSGESNVNLYTGKNGWTEADPYYHSALDAGYKFAIAFIRSDGNAMESKQKQEFEMAEKICTFIHDRLDALGLLASSEAIVEGYGGMSYPNDPREAVMLNDYYPLRNSGDLDSRDPNVWYP